MNRRVRIHYLFSGSLCWECPDHPKAISGTAGPEDWETITISFPRAADAEAGLPFLREEAARLGAEELTTAPRKNPFSTGIGRTILGVSGMTEAEIEFGSAMPIQDTWPQPARNWYYVEQSSIEPGWQSCDFVFHGRTRTCDALVAALYDWNHS